MSRPDPAQHRALGAEQRRAWREEFPVLRVELTCAGHTVGATSVPGCGLVLGVYADRAAAHAAHPVRNKSGAAQVGVHVGVLIERRAVPFEDWLGRVPPTPTTARCTCGWELDWPAWPLVAHAAGKAHEQVFGEGHVVEVLPAGVES